MILTPELRQARRNRLILLALWLIFYGSFTLFTPPLLDDADSVHAEVAREMLTRHDFVTLYANGIRYLEKAPLYYWTMAASMRVFGANTAASRLPLALAVAALTLLMESFARRAFASRRAGLYAGLITLSSFGIFIFSRLNIPDILVCVLLTLSLYAFSFTEQQEEPSRLLCYTFAAAIALNLLTKGLIGIVFPIAIVALYLLLTRGIRGTLNRLAQCHPVSSTVLLLAVAAPWHILIALANPGHGHPGDLARINGHWQVPYPTNGNVHGWAWFYFINEQLYRYLNVRVPHDYDTSPLWLFYGLILIWLMPWSAFLPSAIHRAWLSLAPSKDARPSGEARISVSALRSFATNLRTLTPQAGTNLFLLLWAAVPLLFFSLSTRQEYYVLPSLPPLILLIAAWLERHAGSPRSTSEVTAATTPNPVVGTADAFLRDQLAKLSTIEAALAATGAYNSTAHEAMLDELDKLRNDGRVSDELYHQFRSPLSAARGSSPFDTTASCRPGRGESPARHGSPLGQNSPWRTGARAVSAVLLTLGTLAALACLFFLLTSRAPAAGTDLASLLTQNPGDYALSFGHFLDLTGPAMGLFRLPLALTAIALFGGTLAHYLLRQRDRPNAATLSLTAASFLFLLAAHRGLVIFSPTLTSYQLAQRITPQLHPQDLLAIHGEYEAGSTLGFYLRRNDIHIIEGRSSNLWYGSFFPDALPIFESRESIAQKWPGPQRIFLWQDPHDLDRPPLQLPSPIYVIADSGGKQILSNRP